MIVSVPACARGEAAAVDGGDCGHVDAQQILMRGLDRAVLAQQHRGDLVAVDDHAHDDVAHARYLCRR
jgi:hypothetical protein